MLSRFPVQNFSEIRQSAAGLGEKDFVQWWPSTILNSENFNIWLSGCHGVPKVQLCTQFHQNRMIFCWDMAIWQFSRWQISAIYEWMNKSSRSSIETMHVALNYLVFENCIFVFGFWWETDRWTALMHKAASCCREQRLNIVTWSLFRSVVLPYFLTHSSKGLDTCYSAIYMSQTRDQQRFTISEVAADWHEPMVPQRIMWPSIARANGQLDPRCS